MDMSQAHGERREMVDRLDQAKVWQNLGRINDTRQHERETPFGFDFEAVVCCYFALDWLLERKVD